MKVMHDRVAAIDVHKDMVKVAVRVPGTGSASWCYVAGCLNVCMSA